METKYSLTTLLNDMLKLQNNSYQIVSSLSDLVSSKAETVQIPVLQTDGSIKSVIIPSFGSIKSQLQRIENDIKSLSGINDRNASVRLSDGTFRKILVSNLQKEADDIKTMPIPSSFATKENWFFESFLNPLLYVSFELSDQIKYNTENVEVSRYILNIDTDLKRRIFGDYFQKKSDIQFQNFVKVLINNDIKYFLDRSVTPLPPRSVRYSGKFSVTKVIDDSVIDVKSNTQRRIIKARLDKLSYDDNLSEYIGTQSLKIGDSLVINNNLKNTRYEITDIDSGTRTVSLRLIEGFDSIVVGADILSYYSIGEAQVNVDVNIGFNEYSVIFIKPIDPDSKVASVNWSPGVGLYTNDLTIVENGQEINLAKYYQDKVVDFGAHIYSLSKDGTVPSSLGVTPNAPVLNANELKVVQINKHSTEKNAIIDVKRLHSDKLRVQSDIQSVDNSIKDLRNKIQRTRYASIQLENTDRDKLNQVISQKSSLSNLYSSLINDINSIGTSYSIEDITPKYRVRGFFPMPEPKTNERTGNQEVVQFVIQYRYLSKDGNSNQPESIEFLDNTGSTRRGTFTTWTEVKSSVRRKIEDPVTGNITWIIESVENGDEVNINSIDLPISDGEIVEIRVKSLSEAGWPISPKESDWSTSVQVEFPSSLESQTKISQILQEAREEKVRLQLQKELDQLGFSRHVANSVEQNGKYFAHMANELGSGFLTPEQNIIPLFDKINAMDIELNRLRGLIESTRGVLVVKIVDETGQEYTVANNSTVKLFAGNYRDQVQSLQVKKGVIITKNYFIKLINDSANTLEMYSRFWGSRLETVQPSYSTGVDFMASDTDYNKIRRYDYVPLSLSNPNSNDVTKYGFIRNFPDQSSQVLSQFIYSRYYSVDGKQKLYGDVNDTNFAVRNIYDQYVDYLLAQSNASSTLDLEYNVDFTNQSAIAALTSGSTQAGDFIWKGTNSTAVVSLASITSSAGGSDLYNKNIPIHISHPEIASWIGANTSANITNASNSIRNSILATKSTGFTEHILQTPFYYENTGSTANRYSKVGFEPNDQYLLGPRSVGAYLFLNPAAHTNLTVNGSDSLSVRSINFGVSSAISIPVTFQYRMTDYFGSGKVGEGNLGGKLTFGKNDNLEYTKKIGIDIYSNLLNKERFSFDIEVTARYYSKTVTDKDLPSRTWPSAIDDLSGVIKNINPTTSRDTFVDNIVPNDLRTNANKFDTRTS